MRKIFNHVKDIIISKLDFAFVIAIITSVSYGLTYLYTAGQLRYYNIPIYFLDINSVDIFYTVFYLSPAIFGIVNNMRFDFKKKDLNKSTNGIKKESTQKEITEEITEEKIEVMVGEIENLSSQIDILKAQFDVVEAQINKKEKKQRKIVFLIFFFILVIFSLIYWLVIFVYEYKAWTFILLILYIQFFTFVLVGYLCRKKSYKILFFTVLIFSIAIPYFSGVNSSYMKTYYPVFEENNKDYVVLTYYKDNFIYSQYNKNTNKYKDELFIKEIKEVNEFKMESIGLLIKQN